MYPFTIDHRRADQASLDLSFLLDAPAGKDGFITVKNGHLAKPNGERMRLWGVNITEWSRGSTMLPSHEDAAIYAATLARYGVNCVRLHFLDLPAPRGLIDDSRDDTQHFDLAQLDRLDFWIAELKKHGIYIDLNLAVGRSYKAGDGVQDYDQIGWAKAVTYFDPRLIELQKDYARQLLTHHNPYTETAYRHEPAIAIVELVNENSLFHAWVSDQLHPAAEVPRGPNYRPLTPYYADMLTRLYNDHLTQEMSAEALADLRRLAAAGEDGVVPRLRSHEFARAPKAQFQAEAAFYMELERKYFLDMKDYLRGTLGVQSLLIGTSDHRHSRGLYAKVWTNAALDIIDGHVYWQHMTLKENHNTPMVDDPLYSTVVRLSRTALDSKPYIVSEVNHVMPHDWVCEGIPILAAYAGFQDWDGVIWYTFEPKQDPDWAPYIGDPFDISLDPVRLPQLAAGALMFLRGDVQSGLSTNLRTYSLEQVREALRMDPAEKPYFTPGFPLSTVLQHKVRIGSLEGPPTQVPDEPDTNPLVSDTRELRWYRPPHAQGLVVVDSPRAQALVGFVAASGRATDNLAVEVENEFCAVILVALDGRAIEHAGRLLLTTGARVENTGLQWNESRTAAADWGGPPTLIEPVVGRIRLRNLAEAQAVLVQPLDGAGLPLGDPLGTQATASGWRFTIGVPATTWYAITVEH